MAELNFSNARIEPATLSGWINSTVNVYVSLEGATAIYNASGSQVGNITTRTRLINQQKQLMYLYRGSFMASGTEFYLRDFDVSAQAHSGWKISNISFSNGDTFVFQINASLVCN